MGWVPTNCVRYVASHPAFSSPAVCVTFQSLIALTITRFSFLAVQYLRLKIKLLLSNFLYKPYLLIHRLEYVLCRVVSLTNIVSEQGVRACLGFVFVQKRDVNGDSLKHGEMNSYAVYVYDVHFPRHSP